MNRNKVQSKIEEALYTCITAKGVHLHDSFTQIEIKDFANTIAANIENTSISNIVKNTYKALNSEEDLLVESHFRLNRNIKNSIAKIYRGEHNDNPLILVKLIFSLIQLYQTVSETDLDKEIDEYQDYMLSYMIQDINTLRKEIEINSQKARTIKTDFGYLRLEYSDGSYVPTSQTINNYNKYLKL